MKVFKLVCITFFVITISLLMVGCNEKQEPTAQEKLVAAFNLGSNYKSSMNTTQFTVDEEGKSNGKLVYLNEVTREGTKYKAYTNIISTYVYSISEFSELCSEEFKTELTPETLPSIISLLNSSGMEVDYDEQNDKVTLTSQFVNNTDYYNYDSVGEIKDVYATYYSIGYCKEDYSVHHTLHGVDNLTAFSLDDKYASHFIYNETEDIYVYDNQYANEDGYENDSIIKYNIKLENGKVSKIELHYISGEETKTHLNIECSFVYGNQTVELPNVVNDCVHDYGDEDHYLSEKVDGEYYHYRMCLYCNDAIDVAKCVFNEDGHCDVCGCSLTEDVVFFTVEGYDGYFDGLVYGTINSKTHKVEEVYYDMISEVELTDFGVDKTYQIDGIILDNEKEEYISVAAIFEFGLENYCYVKVCSDYDKIYILNNVTYEVSGEETKTITIHGNIIQTEQIGEVYSKYRKD